MSLSGQILVSTEALVQQADVVRGELANVRESFEEMERLMTATQRFWLGDAAQSHRQLYLSKRGGIEEILRRYQEHVTDLEEMAGVYREAESAAHEVVHELPQSQLD